MIDDELLFRFTVYIGFIMFALALVVLYFRWMEKRS